MNRGDTYSLITSPDPDFTPWEAGSQIKSDPSASQEGVLTRGHLGNRYAQTGSKVRSTIDSYPQTVEQLLDSSERGKCDVATLLLRPCSLGGSRHSGD